MGIFVQLFMNVSQYIRLTFFHIFFTKTEAMKTGSNKHHIFYKVSLHRAQQFHLQYSFPIKYVMKLL